MIVIRCKSCKRFYSVNHNACKYCGNKSTKKDYYVRLNNKDTYAGDSLTVARKLDADMKESKRKRNNNLAEYYETPENTTFQSFITNYFEPHYKAKNKRYEDVKLKVDYFCKHLGEKDINQIQSIDIERAMNSLKPTLSPRTKNYYLSTIRRIYNYAIEIEMVKISPVKMKPLKLDNKRIRFLSPEEEKRLIKACKDSKNKRLLPMVMIALYTGMRRGEILHLSQENIADGKIYLTGDMTKSSKGRVIPIHESVEPYLKGDFNYNTEIKESFGNALKKANITNFKFHDLRHTFASKLRKRGVELEVIQELLGHSTIQMTLRYAHLGPDSTLKAINKL